MDGMFTSSPMGDWTTTWTTIGTLVLAGAAVLALIGLVIGWFTLRDARRTRHGQLVADLSRRWDEPDILASLELFREYGPDGTKRLITALFGGGRLTRDPADTDDWFRMSIYPNLIDSIGVLYDENALSRELVWKMWGPGIIDSWNEWQDVVRHIRAVTGKNTDWGYFEKIAAEMSHVADKVGEPGLRRRPTMLESLTTIVLAVAGLLLVMRALRTPRNF